MATQVKKYTNQLSHTIAVAAAMRAEADRLVSIAKTASRLEVKENSRKGLTDDEEHLLNTLYFNLKEAIDWLEPVVAQHLTTDEEVVNAMVKVAMEAA